MKLKKLGFEKKLGKMADAFWEVVQEVIIYIFGYDVGQQFAD